MSEPHEPRPSADVAPEAADLLDAGLAAGFAVAPEPTGPYHPPAEVVGTVVAGKYKLLEQIGEGGMGTVWVAEQTAPVKRKVALKVIKAGMDSRTILARFEAERQALALMDHPNIAKVFDGGLTEAGRPFFVMEYVKGVPITEYCDATRLSIAERLQLFVAVCQAVQHAHQKGIIHRDLKPSNILVAPYDGKPVPKVIDFGLAKAMHQPLTERTLHTAHEAVLGTPLYMSPEQAQLNNLDVDTRSDVYSLGVVLYELLTGTTPLERQRFKQAAWDEVRRIIREEEPPRPSARLSSSETLPSLAACRQSEPKKLTKQLRGEVDWIVMKALEKDRTRRYETANGLARDVQRYLADEVVEARPPSTGYRLRKFVRRHKGRVIAASLVLCTLLVGIAGTTYGFIQADRKRQQAETNLEYARKSNKVLGSVFVALDPKSNYANVSDLRNALRDNLKKAAKDLEESGIGDPLTVAEMQHTLGWSLVGLGDGDAAVEVLQKATDTRKAHLGPDHPDTLVSMNYLADAYYLARKYDQAVTLYEETLALRKAKLGPEHRDTLMSMNDLASGYVGAGKLDQAVPLYEKTLKMQRTQFGVEDPDTLMTMNNLANVYTDEKKLDLSLPLLEETLRIQKAKIGPNHPHTLTTMVNLAIGLQEAGKIDEALPLYEEALRLERTVLGSDHPSTLFAMKRLAVALGLNGKVEQALPLHEEAWRLSKTRLGPDHPLTLATMKDLAFALGLKGKVEQALPLYEEAWRLSKTRLGPDHKDTLDTLIKLAETCKEAGKSDQAVPLLKEAVELSRARYGLDHLTLTCMDRLAHAYQNTRQFDQALPLFDETLKLRKEKLGPENVQTLSSMNNLAMCYMDAGKLDQALPLLEETLKLQKPALGLGHRDTLTTMNNLAGAYQATGKLDRAVSLWEETLKPLKEKFGPDDPDTLRTMNNLANAYERVKRFDLAVPHFEEMLKRQTAKVGLNHPKTLSCMHSLGNAYAETNQTEKAVATLADYVAQMRKQFPKDNPQLAVALSITATSLLRCGQYTKAEELIRESLAFREKAEPDAWTTFNARSVLGGALLGQKKYDDAEPLLRNGYQGMKEREKTIPANGKLRVPQALDRLIELCAATNRPDEAKKWQAERAKYPPAGPMPQGK
jgi:serine/threonine protein kinase